MTALAQLAARIGRHSVLYGLAAGATVVVGLASVAVLTRLIEPAEYGRLAVLFFGSSLLVVVYNLGSLQGTNRATFGALDDEGDDIDSRDADRRPAAERRRTLGSGLSMRRRPRYHGGVPVGGRGVDGAPRYAH